MRSLPFFAAATGCLSASLALAQDESVIINHSGWVSSGISETRNVIDPERVTALRAASAADVVRMLPSTHIPVNSRGEAIVFLRNAGERQVSVFLDGALLNVPWDNRIDLAAVPSGLIGSAETFSGPISVQYGLNALGVVNLIPHAFAEAGSVALTAEGGTQDASRLGARVDGRIGAVGLLVTGEIFSTDGESLSGNAGALNFQPASGLRKNTDRKISAFSARAGYSPNWGDLRLTLVYSDAAKGIAPEGDRPAVNARFWRYPEIRNFMLIGSGDFTLSENTSLHAAAWTQEFGQTIENYTSASYTVLSLREIDRDRTYGARGVVNHRFGGVELIASANLLTSAHKQQDSSFTGGILVSGAPYLSYAQDAFSTGADLRIPLTGDITLDAGFGYDWLSYTKTGDKPALPGFDGYVAHVGASWNFGEGWKVRAAAGSKARMPTMRDLFGNALNRFLLNPDLKPERVYTGETALTWEGSGFRVFAVPFIQSVEDTIDQRNVGSLRQRINLRGSSVLGLEIAGEAVFLDHWTVNGQLTASRVRRLKDTPAGTSFIAEKPDLLAMLGLVYADPAGWKLGGEVQHIGTAYSANADGTLVPLSASTQLNLQASYAFTARADGPPIEFYIRAENVNDAKVDLQSGLPGPGRSIRGGIRLSVP